MRVVFFMPTEQGRALGLRPLLKSNPNHDPKTGRFVSGTRTPQMRAEKRGLRSLYDTVLREGLAAPESLLVRLTAPDLSVVLGRGPGALTEDGSIVVHGAALKRATGSKRGHGMLKIIWKHGQKSAKDARFRVTRADVLALPEVIRSAPSSTNARDGKPATAIDWHRKRHDGKLVVYAVSKFDGDENAHVVTIYVDDPVRPMQKSDPFLSGEGATHPRIPGRDLSIVRLPDGSLMGHSATGRRAVKHLPLIFRRALVLS